jgi:precorrin-6A/cobalt-precorrin-6A reductase
MILRVLLLAGTSEARQIAAGLATMPGVNATASLAGAVRAPAPLAVPTRIGGFGGAAGFAAFLRQERIGLVVDATHPFARRIGPRSAQVCAARGVGYLRVLRPAWQAGPGDLWTSIAAEEDAANHIPAGATVFLATGAQRLNRFANLAGRRVICRVIDPPGAPCPVAGGAYVVSHPPHDAAAESALFRRLRVDWVVARNAGGAAGRGKLDAARALRIPVALIARPAQPAVAPADGPVDGPEAALAAIAEKVWTNAS